MWPVALAWCLTLVAGLVVQQTPGVGAPSPPMPVVQSPPLPTGVSAEATTHILMNIKKLHEAATAAVSQQSTLLSAVFMRKEQEAQQAIEKEIPLAAANDTQELAKDLAEEDKQLGEAAAKSTAEAKEALGILKDKTGIAVNMSALRSVRDVEKEAEVSAINIANHSIDMQAEAAALANEALGAANFSAEAAKNSALWVKELPVKDAAQAVRIAESAEQGAIRVRHEYEDVKRMAKLAGNLALSTINLANEAVETSKKAQEESILTVEQAAQNAQLLKTVRDETKAASQTSMRVIDAMRW